MSTTDSTSVGPQRSASAALILVVLALAAWAAATVFFFKGALGHDHSDLCDTGEDASACEIDVEANQRQQDLVFTFALASGAVAVVLTGGAAVAGIAAVAGRRSDRP